MPGEHFYTGEQVVVRSVEEILATLDADGTLDRLPFMSEMIDWCGKSFRVQRRVEKTCTAAPPGTYPNRRFARNDVVILEGPRCDGAGHDGCGRRCRFYWKEAWLRRAEGAPAGASPSPAALAELRARLRVKEDAERYFCQSTRMIHATEEFPGRKKIWMTKVAMQEVRNGDRGAIEVTRQFLMWFSQRAMRTVAGEKRWMRGKLNKTPTQSLGLKPGDQVRVRSRKEIIATLDVHRRNRGMTICHEMARSCGQRAEVEDRVERIIDELSGRMRIIQNTVLLRNIGGSPTKSDECLCFDEPGDCPRGEVMYWREIWLERV